MAVVCGTMSIVLPILHDSESGYDGNMSIDSSDMGSDSTSAWSRDCHIGLKYQATSTYVAAMSKFVRAEKTVTVSGYSWSGIFG